MNRSSGVFLAGIGPLVLLLAGCATGPTRLESAYGTSYHSAIVSQTLDPEAAKNLAPLEGFDGKAAKGMLDRYHESFEKPPPPPSFVISVGGIK
jgi:hypothetical protein